MEITEEGDSWLYTPVVPVLLQQRMPEEKLLTVSYSDGHISLWTHPAVEAAHISVTVEQKISIAFGWRVGASRGGVRNRICEMGSTKHANGSE